MRRNFFIILFVLLTMGLSGCLPTTQKKTPAQADGGLFISLDKGETWQQKSLIPGIDGKPHSFANVDAASLALDPNDPQAIYFGSFGSGLLYSYNKGEYWQQVAKLEHGTIEAIAVDPHNKCTLYAATANKVYKTEDCLRTWQQVYYDNEVKVRVTTIAIDHYNSSIVYIGVSRGDVIKSVDGGKNWATIQRFRRSIYKILIDPNDSRTVYAVTDRSGLYQTMDSGKNWKDFEKILKDLDIQTAVQDVALSKKDPSLVVVATGYGMIRSHDKGKTWEKIKLIPPEKQASIRAMTINQNNSKEIFYVTNTTFYRSVNGGDTWRPIKLPSTRAGNVLLVSQNEPATLYLGLKSGRKR